MMNFSRRRWLTENPRVLRRAVWLARWGFLIPACVLASFSIPWIGETVQFWPPAFLYFVVLALPALALTGFLAARRTRADIGRLLLLTLTVCLYGHVFGRGVTKLLFGGFA